MVDVVYDMRRQDSIRRAIEYWPYGLKMELKNACEDMEISEFAADRIIRIFAAWVLNE